MGPLGFKATRNTGVQIFTLFLGAVESATPHFNEKNGRGTFNNPQNGGEMGENLNPGIFSYFEPKRTQINNKINFDTQILREIISWQSRLHYDPMMHSYEQQSVYFIQLPKYTEI